MDKIKSIEQLIIQLKQCSKKEMKGLYSLLDIPKAEFEPYLHWNNNQYTRNCIFRNDDFELLVLCWDNKQESSIHYHNNQECWLYNIIGEFKELRYKLIDGIPKLTDNFNLETNRYSYMNDDMGLHKVINTSNSKSASLHLYAKPIDECKHYNPQTKLFEISELNYHSINGKLIETI